MALQKQPVALNFARGLDLKTDPYQTQLGSFLSLTNSVFTTTGRLTKRSGFANLTNLPNTEQTTLTTLNDNLIATGSNLYAYSETTNQWLNKGTVQPVQLDVQSMVRSNTSQTGQDTAVAQSGLAALVYEDSGSSYYQISDSSNGQQIVARTLLATGAVNPRVFILGIYFIITYVELFLGTPTIRYVAIPLAVPTTPNPPATFTANLSSMQAGYDGFSTNNTLYISWGATGATVKIAFLTQSLVMSPTTTIAGAADLMSVTADETNFRIYISYWDTTSNNGFSASFDYTLIQFMAITPIIVATEINTITSIADAGILTIFYENANSYAFTGGAVSDFVSTLTVTAPPGMGVGTPSSTTVLIRSVGLASKPFRTANGTIYIFVTYGDPSQSPASNDSNQPTYFLIDSTGAIYLKIAYSNAGGYANSQVIPSISVISDQYYFPYLITDFLATVNKGISLPTGTPVNAIYTQTGINLAKFSIDTNNQQSSEIADALHLTGGQLWEFDGVKPVEHSFHVYPENAIVEASVTPGGLTPQIYYYVFTYEWTDNQGRLHRSAPSIPVLHTVTTETSVDCRVPTLRLTYKTQPNPVRIVGYRWSTAQQTFYQFTSLTSPTVNNPAVDFVTIHDGASDLAILGQTLLYTTGGVIENIGAPASIDSCLFVDRLFLIDAEDRNLLWYSKQVIQSVPVEMSDLLTIYVAPTTGAQGSTGPMTALGAMDDKLVVFKKDAIYYITGSGPDNTGANNNFSEPVFVTGTVGCDNPDSIVLIPNGIMFQSDKGIWLLGRDLSTKYIGAPVESYNNSTVMSATAIPGTNEVRFVLSSNTTLMYDYFFDQWATHTNISAISATLHEGLHTYLNSYGSVFQENPGSYVDGSVPVLMSLTTSWINVAGIQGLERFYFANLLGTYFTPFTLSVQLAYDYNSSARQAITVRPDNYSKSWGDEAQWGGGPPWGGGPGNVFSARIFPEKQKCQSFQVFIQEVYDPSLGVEPGQGLSLSGLALVVGMKRGFRTQKASRSFG